MDKLSKRIELEEMIAYLEYQIRQSEIIERSDLVKLNKELNDLKQKRNKLFGEI